MSDSRLKLLTLGSCNLNIPLSYARDAGAVRFALQEHGIATPVVLTLAEAIQAVSHHLGLRVIPPEMRRYCDVDERDVPPERFKQALASADIVLLEPNTSISVRFRNYYINRTVINNEILKPLEAAGSDIISAGRTWFNQGILRLNDDARLTAARVLVGAIEDEVKEAELKRAIISEARPLKEGGSCVVDQIRQLHQLLGIPMGVVTYNHQYLPDGRTIPWPPEFVSETINASKVLDLPLMEPSKIVQAHGVANAMKPDRVHYKPEFEPIMGQAFCDFARACIAPLTES